MAKNREHDNRYLLSSVNNALKILEVLMVRDNVGLKEITDITGFDKTSVFKMLYTLEYRGFVQRAPHSKYKLGRKLSSYAHIASIRQNILDVAQSYMLKLWANTQQTILLCVLNATGKVVIMATKLEKDQDSIRGRIGAEMDAYSCSAGKMALANLPIDVQKSMLKSIELIPHTENTVKDIASLVEQLQELRGKLSVSTCDEHQIGHADMASPIYDHEGNCIACISIVSSPETIKKNHHFYKQQLQNASIQLSTQMGYQGYV